MSRALESREYDDLVSSLSQGLMAPRDQLTKLKALAHDSTLTCEQAIGIVNVVKTVQVDAIVTLYPAISDKENFEKVLNSLKWPEERQEVKTALGLP